MMSRRYRFWRSLTADDMDELAGRAWRRALQAAARKDLFRRVVRAMRDKDQEVR